MGFQGGARISEITLPPPTIRHFPHHPSHFTVLVACVRVLCHPLLPIMTPHPSVTPLNQSSSNAAAACSSRTISGISQSALALSCTFRKSMSSTFGCGWARSVDWERSLSFCVFFSIRLRFRSASLSASRANLSSSSWFSKQFRELGPRLHLHESVKWALRARLHRLHFLLLYYLAVLVITVAGARKKKLTKRRSTQRRDKNRIKCLASP